jgi:hypothetical protein
MDLADLRLPVSTRLQLTFVGLDYKRYPCDALLLGFRADETVLVYLPNKPPQVLLRENIKVEVRSALQSGIIKFESAVELICERPYTYLHLTYPRSVELEPLRRYPRFPLETPLALNALSALGITTARLRGRFCDISLEGARLATEKELTSAVSKVLLTAGVTVAGMKQSLELTGAVKRAFGRSDKVADFPFIYGVSFIEPTPPQRLLLLALCHELQSGAAYGEGI